MSRKIALEPVQAARVQRQISMGRERLRFFWLKGGNYGVESTTAVRETPIGGESGTPFPFVPDERKPPKNKDSKKARSKFVTTGVYHLPGPSRTRFSTHFGGDRAISSKPA